MLLRLPISIHALREEGDCIGRLPHRHNRDFYPRPPRGGRPLMMDWMPCPALFLSTPSARRATWHQYGASVHQSISIHALREEGDRRGPCPCNSARYFYPRPPRGGRLGRIVLEFRDSYFYPRPPRGGRRDCIRTLTTPARFLSTPSARRATFGLYRMPRLRIYFYPRPPRGGRRPTSVRRVPRWNFYPRPPRGGRQDRTKDQSYQSGFLSTPSARRATV